MLQRTLLPLVLGLVSVGAVPTVAQADPDECGRSVYVYDGYDTYRVPRRERSRTRWAPRTRRVYAPPPRATPVSVERCLLPEEKAQRIVRKLQRYRFHARSQLRVLRDVARRHLVTVEQAACFAELVCASRDRSEALVTLFTALDEPCCTDYVGLTQHLLDHCDREPYAWRIAELQPSCAHPGSARPVDARPRRNRRG